MKPHEIAMQHLGVPFRHRGRSQANADFPGALDCIGLLVLVAHEMGLQVFDKKCYGREPFKDGLREGLVQHFGPPVSRPAAVDDVVLMRMHPFEEPGHVGIVAPHRHGLALVHTYAAQGKVVYARIDEYRQRQIVEAYAWPGVAE